MHLHQVFSHSYLFHTLLVQSQRTEDCASKMHGGLWLVEKSFRDRGEDTPKARLRALNTSDTLYLKRTSNGKWEIESEMLPPSFIKAHNRRGYHFRK